MSKRIATLLFILLMTLSLPVMAQQPEYNADFTAYFKETYFNADPAYWRVADNELPVKVCETEPLSEAQHTILISALEEMNTAVPTVFTTDTGDCHIFITVVFNMPDGYCLLERGGQAPACVMNAGIYAYPVEAIFEVTIYMIATVEHELMHGFGVFYHVENEYDSALHSTLDDPYRTHLSERDKDILRDLYSRPVYGIAQQADNHAVAVNHDQRYCEWVERNQEKLTAEAYERYRCE